MAWGNMCINKQQLPAIATENNNQKSVSFNYSSGQQYSHRYVSINLGWSHANVKAEELVQTKDK